jgi:hypothetical protein
MFLSMLLLKFEDIYVHYLETHDNLQTNKTKLE